MAVLPRMVPQYLNHWRQRSRPVKPPPALARVPRLYCRNERALISYDIGADRQVALIPVAAGAQTQIWMS